MCYARETPTALLLCPLYHPVPLSKLLNATNVDRSKTPTRKSGLSPQLGRWRSAAGLVLGAGEDAEAEEDLRTSD